MGSIAAQMADFVFVTSDNSRSESPGDIIGDILQGMEAYDNFAVIPDRRQAIFAAVESAGAGDIILLAGKGHETYEIDGDGRHPFDEKAIVKEAVARLLQNKQADDGAV